MGGHVFGVTSPIARENINQTVEKFKSVLRSIFTDRDVQGCIDEMVLLGSAGKKDVSGDIDLGMPDRCIWSPSKWGIDIAEVKRLFKKHKAAAKSSPDILLIKRAIVTGIAQKIEQAGSLIYKVSPKATLNGTIFCCFPQFTEDGKQTEFNVQVDVNIAKLEMLKFSCMSVPSVEQSLKGLHRTQLIVALLSSKGYAFTHAYGVKEKETGRVVATSPQGICDIINKEYNAIPELTTWDLSGDFYRLWDALTKSISKGELEDAVGRYLSILDKTPGADIPEVLQRMWVEHKEELRLTGKWLPAASKLK